MKRRYQTSLPKVSSIIRSNSSFEKLTSFMFEQRSQHAEASAHARDTAGPIGVGRGRGRTDSVRGHFVAHLSPSVCHRAVAVAVTQSAVDGQSARWPAEISGASGQSD